VSKLDKHIIDFILYHFINICIPLNSSTKQVLSKYLPIRIIYCAITHWNYSLHNLLQ